MDSKSLVLIAAKACDEKKAREIKLININRPKILFKNKIYNCQLGLKGKLPIYKKKEGDFATPIGKWKLGKIFVRTDKLPFLKTKKYTNEKIITK